VTGPDLTVGRRVVDEMVRLAAYEIPGVARVSRGGPRWRALLAGPAVVTHLSDDGVRVRVWIVARPGQPPVDLTASVRAAVAEAERRLGAIDILVNCAGWDKVEPFLDNSEETWDRVLDINLKGVIRCTRAVLDGMISRGSGCIVSVSSDAGRVGSSGEVVYSGAKAGIIGFSKGVARETARHGLRVNVVCPGPTNTPLMEATSRANPKLGEALVKAIPFRRLAEPDEIAAAVVFLASADAAFITGQTLSVSGGLTMV
jgi:2-hydroxycyclohexanecarboxyl-CoA dehydrogenase